MRGPCSRATATATATRPGVVVSPNMDAYRQRGQEVASVAVEDRRQCLEPWSW